MKRVGVILGRRSVGLGNSDSGISFLAFQSPFRIHSGDVLSSVHLAGHAPSFEH